MPDFKPLPKPVKLRKPAQNNSKKPAAKERSVKTAKKPPINKAVPTPRPIKVQPERQLQRTKPNPSLIHKQANRAKRFLRKKSRRALSIGVALVIAVPLLIFLIFSMRGHNALAVYIGENRLGYIAFSQEISEASLRAEAIRMLEIQENAQVQVNEQISIRPTNTAQRNMMTFSNAIEQLASSFTFQIVGTALELNGNRIAILRSQNDAEEVIWRLQSPFLQSRLEDYYIVDFVEDLRMTNATVEESDLSTVQQVLQQLEGRSVVVEEYIVQPGDTLGGIALLHNTTLANLLENNPGLTANTILRVGDALRIESYRPYLSVRTVLAETRSSPIPIEDEQLENPGEVNTFSQVIQEGSAGEAEIVVHTTRINGIQTEPEQIVATRVIREMTPRITEVGTMEPVAERR